MKKNILFFILGLVIASMVSVSAAVLYNAKDISYSNELSSATNVEEALSELYDNQNKTVQIGNTIAGSSNSTTATITGFEIGKYYSCLSSVKVNVNTSSLTGAEVLISKYQHEYLDYKYSAHMHIIKANNTSISFYYPGSTGFYTTCYEIEYK